MVRGGAVRSFFGGEADLMGNIALPMPRGVGVGLGELLLT
jgi:hypothetical protein